VTVGRGRALAFVVLLAGSLLAGGCGMLFGEQGVFRDRSEDYRRAPELPEIEVPEDMDSGALREIYVIPPVRDSLDERAEFEVPRPAPLVVGADADVVRIQKLGDASWALVGLAPGQVWPQVRNFLTAAGLQVLRVDARAGIIETDWLTLKDRPLQSRFRFRMEQGVQRGTSELHVLQMNRTGENPGWPPRSDDPDQAQEMLLAVAQFLADTADSTPVSMVADQGMRAGGRISVEEAPQGYRYIRLELPFNRAWASLGRALEESFFEITDRDRSAGIYYARFVGEAGSKPDGWFDWLWDAEEHPLAGRRYLVTMQVVDEREVTIRLQPQEGEGAVDQRQEQGLLELLKGNID